MKIGVYADTHITKNMRSLQDIWNVSATESIYHMYNHFDDLDVESVVCLGDFFDAPRIEAKHMNLILPILDSINNRSYPTYILLGNHEAESTESNILDFLTPYDNIIPITSTTDIEGMLFIPYYEDPSTVDIKSNHIVFTHHDIYGSELASGQTKAFFGLSPDIFKNARLVMNGHVHLRSKVSNNIINAGSLLASCQGELRVGDYPSYYLLDTNSCNITAFDNKYSMIYLSIDLDRMPDLSQYEQSKLVLRVDYEGEMPTTWFNTLHTSWRKKLSTIGDSSDTVIHHKNFDMKNYLIDYLNKDAEIPDSDKEDYISTGLEMIS